MTSNEAAAYPAHREADVVLRDGSTVRVRPARQDDREALGAFLGALSLDSRYFRFFSGSVNIERAASEGTDVDYRDRYALLAMAGSPPVVVGHAVYLRTGPERAEVAFAVADQFQGRGLGTILLGHLAEAAVENGVATFEATVLPENHRMAEVFRESGFPAILRSEPGLVVVEFPTSLSSEALERFERREQTAAVAALDHFLRPAAVAVIGASRSRGTIGAELFHNLLATEFEGPVYPVNPKSQVVQSVVAYPSILDVPGEVELAVISVPAAAVLDAARQCGEKGVRALVVISSGFAEMGVEGRERQRALMEVCRDYGMRLIGPNCMGIINTAPDVRLNATFSPGSPPHGTVAFSSQSGAIGIAVIEHASALGLGLSSFVSVGNKADISGNDLIHYWEQDEDTSVILLYLESFGNPRKFARITKRVARTKPIIAVKSGRSSAGARATSSHTGALIAASDVTVDALFHQAGVIRTETLAELFDVASLLANQPPPSGNRVGILTNAGGLGIMCADACEGHGLEVPTLPEAARDALAEFLPPEASLANPVDMIASATAGHYERAIDILANKADLDALIVLFIPPLVTRAQDVAQAIRTAVGQLDRSIPVLTVFLSEHGVPDQLQSDGQRIPSYRFPEDAARALARAVQYGTWRARPEGSVPSFSGLRSDEATGLVAEALAGGGGWLAPDQVARLLACYGLPAAETRLVGTPADAAAAAGEIGAPVALKAVAPGLIHKTEAGAVRLSLEGAESVLAAAEDMKAGVEAAGHTVEGFVVQRMVDQGIEMIVGVVHDPLFGPVVACGAGGTAVELVKDVSVRITPLTDLEASDMVRSLRTFPLLEGYRGGPKGDVPALEEIILRVGALVESHPEIAEMDLNPVVVLSEGASIVDARVRVEASAPPRPLGARSD